MKAVITQPNLFPWLGYFHQVKEADVFIVLDNVQYNKREWQNRNRIVMRNGVIKYLTIPVKKAPQKTQIANIYVSDSFNPKTLSDAFASAYANTPLFDQALNTLDKFLALYASSSCNHLLLRDLNVNFIKYICDLLGWSKTILFASDLMSSNSSVDYSATARLVQLCKIVGATEYLSSIGSRDYIMPNLHLFTRESIQVFWQSFVHTAYIRPSASTPFISHMSILDYICHQSLFTFTEYLDKCGTFNLEKVD